MIKLMIYSAWPTLSNRRKSARLSRPIYHLSMPSLPSYLTDQHVVTMIIDYIDSMP